MKTSSTYSVEGRGVLHATRNYFFRLVIVAVAAMLAQPPPTTAGEADAKKTTSHAFTNRLIHSRNPYLLLHAHNPVDWYPWGPEAFARARTEDKPVFVSIGYSTCFWCHVAERTIYSNPEIAELMNQWFINVKVDREQRPDVDRVYLLATQLIAGRGGWPNNVFLTHDGEPFFAGSYFPPEDDPLRGPGFPTILRSVHDAWLNRREEIEEAADSVAAALRRIQSEEAAWVATPIRPGDLLKKARRGLLGRFDSTWGGIAEPTSGAKFPRAPQLAMFLADYRIHQNRDSLAAVRKTLEAMSYGGIHDHLGGGFHRYSVDSSWSVPHFEKMLYDNAQLLQLFAALFEITGEPFHRSMAIETGRYLGRDMMSPEGGFYTARDAQVDGVEGASYLWTQGQIADVLGEEAAARFLIAYVLTPLPHPNVSGVLRPPAVNGEQPGALHLRRPVEETLRLAGFENLPRMLNAFAADRAKLLAARYSRPQPARDEKIITSQNGLAIAALADSAAILGEPRFLSWAERAAERIWTLAYQPKSGMLKREIFLGEAQTDGFLEDYAMLGRAFLSLARATGRGLWRDRAVILSQNVIDRFLRADGSLSTTPYEAGFLIPVLDRPDLDMPSATSAALDLLLQTNGVVGNSTHFEAAALMLNRLSGKLDAFPEAWSSAMVAINRHPVPESVMGVSGGKVSSSETPLDGATAFPTTANHLRVSAVMRSDESVDEVIVTIEVDDGYHINANPASFDYLIPTSVAFEHAEPLKIRYPDPIRFAPAFAPDGLDVYTGSLNLVATFPKDSLKIRQAVNGLVRAQACDDRVCLPPSNVPFSIAGTGMR